jgi:hypothetical protein
MHTKSLCLANKPVVVLVAIFVFVIVLFSHSDGHLPITGVLRDAVVGAIRVFSLNQHCYGLDLGFRV